MADQYIHSMTDTWNSGGTTFYAIKMNVTDAASASDSKLLDLQVGGTSMFGVRKDGAVLLKGNLITAKGADVASATALPLIGDGNIFDVTGTTTITSFASMGVGTIAVLHFDGALTLTHHATDLVLPGGANIVTAAGDEAIFYEYASGDWRCLSYQRSVRVTGWETISEGAFSGSSALNFTNLSPFIALDFDMSFLPGTNGANIRGYTSTNNGSSYDTGASDYSYNAYGYVGAGVINGDGVGAFLTLNWTGFYSTLYNRVRWNVMGWNKAVIAHFDVHAMGFTSSGGRQHATIQAYRQQSTARDAISIQPSTGTITGNYILRGLRG